MRKTELQRRAVTLIGQLSTEKLKVAVDYLIRLQDKAKQNSLPVGVDPTTSLGTAIHAIFKSFGGVELEIPPREPMREPPRFET